MCEVRDHDGRPMRGRARFNPDDGGTGLLMRVREESRFIADDGQRSDCDASDFDFFCRHGDDEPWEPIALPPPPGKVVVVPAGSTIRAVPKDPAYVIPEPEPPKLVLGGMV